MSLALPPYLLSRAVDDGLASRNGTAFAVWTAILVLAGVVNAALGIARHRTMTKVRMTALFQVTHAVVDRCCSLGAALSSKIATGSVIAVGITDARIIAQSLTVAGPGIGAVVTYVGIAILMYSISAKLAVVVLVGIPAVLGVVGPLLRRAERSGSGYRAQEGALISRLVATLSGLRVLNALGGKGAFASRYQCESRRLRDNGYQMGSVLSWISALATGMPALFLGLVTWLAARMAAEGAITIGSMIAVYGYAAILVVPVATLIEGADDLAGARVAGRMVIELLKTDQDPAISTMKMGVVPPEHLAIYDIVSGVEVRPGVLTALVSARTPDVVAIIDRLGMLVDSDAMWGDIRLDEVPIPVVRERICVADNDAAIFAGTLRELVAGRRRSDDRKIETAITSAVAADVAAALPDGLDSSIASGGSNVSGGQRQRLRLARVLYAEPEILLAVEPTSAVDAHTEAKMAASVKSTRAGRTTVVSTSSPLVLDRADTVVFIVGGKAVGTGSHRSLLETHPGYRELVTRGHDGSVDR